MRQAPARLKVYASHNVEVDFRRCQPPTTLHTAMLRRVEALERRAVRDSDLVLACTDSDASRLRELYGRISALEVIPNGFDAKLLNADMEGCLSSWGR